MTTDQEKARALAAKAWEFCEQENWVAAISKYEEAARFIDSNHWSSQDIFGEFALALGKIGRTSDATMQLRNALESAELTDGPNSIGANIARYFLADNLFRQNQIDAARTVIQEWLNVESEGKWMMNYMAATISCAEGDDQEVRNQASIAMRDGPKEKWRSLDEVLESIAQEMRS